MPLKDANNRIDCNENKQENRRNVFLLKQSKTHNKKPAIIFPYRLRHYFDILTQYEVTFYFKRLLILMNGPTLFQLLAVVYGG